MHAHPRLRKAALAPTLALFVVALFAVSSLDALVVPAPAAHASTATDEQRFYDATNQLRASLGIPGLTLDAGMSAVARTWSLAMAAAGNISHNPTRGDQITGWSILGENVGMGSSVDIVENALVNSPPHYENLTNSQFVLVGIGVAYGPNLVYVTEDFVAPAGGGSQELARSEPASDPAPSDAPPVTSARRTTTTRATVPDTTPPATEPTTTTPAPPPAAPPAAAVADPSIAFVLDQVRDWTSSLFAGSSPSITVEAGGRTDTSHGGGGH